MWLLIESFSLDRAVYFLPSREISSAFLSFALLSPCSALLCVSLFLFRAPSSANARGISVARVTQTEISSQSRCSD